MKATIQQHRGDLAAAETACAQMQGEEEQAAAPSTSSSSSRKRQMDVEAEIMESQPKRVAESGSILKDISQSQQQPTTARVAFANYVRDSLMTMSKANYKKVRSSINRVLSQLMEEDSDDDTDDLPSATATVTQRQAAPGPSPVHSI